uniref:Reverse transcriptase domain-containing protein n=1 Tax=Oreochromis niloticus TaxID=8128 RepID=A0A669EC77_ORENI
MDAELDKFPPGHSNRISTTLKAVMVRLKLTDIWRFKYPQSKMFTWCNNSNSRHSRIDFWLVSESFDSSSIDVGAWPSPATDHKAIYIKINLTSLSNSSVVKFTYWKLNSSLLQNDDVKKDLKDLISKFWSIAQEDLKYGNNWELLKFEIGKYLRKVGSLNAKSKRLEEENIISQITQLSNKQIYTLTEEDKLNLAKLQDKLDCLYSDKAKGAFIRSRSKWLEEGERNSHYFFSLEKKHSSINNISKLMINGVITEDYRLISKHCSHFYKELYSSTFSQEAADHLLESLNVKSISQEDSILCDQPISLEEVKNAIGLLKNNKSPGTDGLTAELYKTFSEELSPFLLEVFVESIGNQQLPTTMNQGLTTLIPKPNKDLLMIDNWRPISLLNNDYKLFALIIANRLKMVLESVIDETQSGFMPKRHITNNIRLVLDILDYSDLINSNVFILFLDFYKAFDTVEHEFIFQALDKYGFGTYFSTAIKTLYHNSNSSIKLTNGTSPRFNIQRGIRQGCPISPYLFLLIAQLLSNHIKSSNVKGISLIGKDLLITQLADDTTLFLKDEYQIFIAIETISMFSKASGLYLNIPKCELMAIKECSKTALCNIPIKQEVRYLGIIITKNQERITQNFYPILEKLKHRFNQWLLRDLSLKGRVLITKAEGISRLAYAALALHLDNKLIKEVDKLLFNFIWKNRTHYIKKTVLMNPYVNGGLNVLDFNTLNNTFKINWLKNLITKPTSIWNTIPVFMFSKLGGTEFFLTCNFDIDKTPLKISAFHRQAFLAWTLIYKHNFSPHSYYIWNNKDILFKRKSLFLDSWFRNNIVLVNQLFDLNGTLFSYEEFCLHFNLAINRHDYTKVFGSIPSGVCMLFKNQPNITSFHRPLASPIQTLVGKICFSKQSKNNKSIRALFQSSITTVPYVIFFWNRLSDGIMWNEVWRLPNQFLITNKIKDISYKLIHRIYPSKDYLQSKFSLDIDTS